MKLAGFVATFFVAIAVSADEATFEPLPTEGQTFIHDPSTIVKDGERYFIFGTGRGILTKSSPDLIHWTDGAPVFKKVPAWTKDAVPDFRNDFWAPDIIRLNGKFYLYYAVSTWGKQISAIGLATNPTLDQSSTNYHWTDCGPVIESTNGSEFNTIDPSVMLDADGKLWMAFGSYWNGIYLTQLDAKTGLRATNSALYHLAWNDSIEACCLTRRKNFYYLFVDWGQCCDGTNTTYEVRIGRAAKITGPYLDHDGKNMVDGGGTKFLESNGRFIGPGHIGILDENDTIWFSYEFYDGLANGRSHLALGKLIWKDGWPVPTK